MVERRPRLPGRSILLPGQFDYSRQKAYYQGKFQTEGNFAAKRAPIVPAVWKPLRGSQKAGMFKPKV
jgi:hypothetical protein